MNSIKGFAISSPVEYPSFLPGRIEALKVSVIARDAQQFDRKSEIPI
jgi:hypothetical protein